jgi:hypothetical protein
MFRLGYEIEFCSDRSQRQVLTALKGLGVNNWSNAENRDEFPWHIHNDGSIDQTDKDYAHEISSEVMGYTPGLDLLEKIFENMESANDKTNKTCGFHVNLSFIDPNLTKRINIGRLVLFLDEQRILEKFNRHRNNYCRSHRFCLSQSREYQVGGQLREATLANSTEVLNSIISREKYRTVNFWKLGCRVPYLEFRAMGGKDYHKRYQEICECIKHFTEAMEYSLLDTQDDLYRTRFAEIQSLVAL